MLQPDNVVYMLEKVANQELQLLNFHRQKLIFRNTN